MQRTIRWQFYTKRQRDIALGLLLGSSLSTGLGAAYYSRRPLLAHGGSLEQSKSWRSKSTVISSDSSTSKDRSQDSADKKDIQAPESAKNTQDPPLQSHGHSPFEGKDDLPEAPTSAWQEATKRVAAVSDSFTGFDFASIRSKITDTILPSWIRMLPEYVHKVQDELSGAPYSLGWEIWEDAHDAEINPEIVWDASVRISRDLCSQEQDFRQKRLQFTAKALAKYLNVPESEVQPEDVPVIAMCGSGGGLRALVAGASSSLCAQEAGLLDCVTYTAGVSGSCWLQTLYNSSIGQQDHARVIEHLKHRIGVHIAYPPNALKLFSQAPTNKFLLSGFVEKLRGVPDADFGVVDIYGLLLAARLLVPKGELNVSANDLKVSNQRYSVQSGAVPMPIYTAVRHEIPEEMKGHIAPSQSAWYTTKHYDWFQWFEWTPYEFFCEELGCGIPTWSVGRSWNGGETVWRDNGLALPELRVPLMLGIWGSAFCATLSHYYKEIRPLLKTAGLDKLDGLLAGKDDDLVKVHPVDPALIPNFCLGLRDKLPDTTPESIHSEQHLQLMDAGMSNNLPIYPLLRPGRDVDVIIAFDASADVKTDNWVKVVDGYARQRGIQGWPMGAGWPPQTNSREENAQQLEDKQDANHSYNHEASQTAEQNDEMEESVQVTENDEDLGYCNVWVGQVHEKHEYMDEVAGRRVRGEDDESHLTSPDAGIALIYFPFLANDKVSGVDPMKSDFMSTWNFVYKPEEIDSVVRLAKANFEEGQEQTKRTIRAVWERKKARRLQGETAEKEFQRMARMVHTDGVGQWDHFSGH